MLLTVYEAVVAFNEKTVTLYKRIFVVSLQNFKYDFIYS